MKQAIKEYKSNNKNILPVYFDGKYTSQSLLDFNCSGFSFDEEFLKKGLHKKTFFKSPFKELVLDKFGELGNKSLHDNVFGKMAITDLSFKEFVFTMKYILEQILMEMDDNEKYLVFHSAGYDCRMISLCMMNLRNQGIKSFSNVHFRCHQPENTNFIKQMELQGWDKSQYSIYQEPEEDCYNVGSDKFTNGWTTYYHQMDFWSDIPNYKDYILITGVGNIPRVIYNYKFSPDTKFYDIAEYLKKRNMETIFGLDFKGIFLPFYCYEWFRGWKRYLPEYKKYGEDGFREKFIENYGIEFLGNTEKDINGKYKWNISQKRKKDMVDRFYGSKFYSIYKNKLPKEIDFFQESIKSWENYLWGFAVGTYEKLQEKK